jgi:hypothetical protein
MPFKSEAQRRLFHIKADKGEISKETVSEWEHATKNKKKLPMHVKKAHAAESQPMSDGNDYDQGAAAALTLFSKAANMGPPATGTHIPTVNPAPVIGSAATQAVTNIHPMAHRAAHALVGGTTGAILNAAMAPSGDRLRQGGIGFVSDAVGSALGPWGMLASPLLNMALQHVTAPKQEEKRADHADDRLKERIKTEFPPDALAKLRAQAKGLELAPGRYYLPMKDKAGNTAAIAAFKTVGPKDQLVLATVLAPKKNPPPGTSLSHLMKQPMGSQVAKINASPKQYIIRKGADGRYTCTCKSFKFHHRGAGTNCKHINEHLGITKEAANKMEQFLLNQGTINDPQKARLREQFGRTTAKPGVRSKALASQALALEPGAMKDTSLKALRGLMQTPHYPDQKSLERTRRINELSLTPKLKQMQGRSLDANYWKDKDPTFFYDSKKRFATPGEYRAKSLRLGEETAPTGLRAEHVLRAATARKPVETKLSPAQGDLVMYPDALKVQRARLNKQRGTPNQTKPWDATEMRQTLEHEGGERTMVLEGVRRGKPTAPYSSHWGSDADVAANLIAAKDPKSTWTPDNPDSFIEQNHFDRLYKQMGGTRGSPIPVDSRQSRALSRRIGDVMAQAPLNAETKHDLSSALEGGIAGMPLHPKLEKRLMRDYSLLRPDEAKAPEVPQAEKSQRALETLKKRTRMSSEKTSEEKIAIMDPHHKALAALGTGAALGGLGGYALQKYRQSRQKEEGKPEEEQSSPLAGAAGGMLGGALTGGLANSLFATSPDVLPNIHRQGLSPEEYAALQQKHEQYKKNLNEKGVWTNTYHKRIAIPKSELSESQIRALGYHPVVVAVPEGGQDRFTSFRNTSTAHHIHSHPEHWTMHEDEHPSTTMLMARNVPAAERAKALVTGLPHILTEGVPGVATYLRGGLGRAFNTFMGYDDASAMVPRIKHEMQHGTTAPTGFVRQLQMLRGMKKKASYAPMPALPEEEPQAVEQSPGPEKEKKTSWWPSLAAAGAIGLGTYGLMRRPSFSKIPGLRALQEVGSREGFHRTVDMTQAQNRKLRPGFLGRIEGATRPEMNEKGVLDWKNRLLFHAREGVGAVPIGSEDGKQWVALPGHGKTNAGKPLNVKGLVYGRHEPSTEGPENQPMAHLLRGGSDVEGSMATQKALTDMAQRHGKGFEADLLMKHAPESVPESLTDMGRYHPGVQLAPHHAKQRIQAVNKLQQQLAEHMGADNFVLKPQKTVQSQGQFPWGRDQDGLGGTNWGEEIAKFDKRMRTDRRFRQNVEKNFGQDYLTKEMRQEGLLPGYTLHSFLKDPKTVFAQRGIPEPIGEWRAHVMGGAAPPSMMMPREGGLTHGQQKLMGMTFPKEDMSKFIQETMAKLPPEYRDGTYGMDVMPYKKPDGTLGFKIVEMNPTERFTPGLTTGGGSGMLAAHYLPTMGLHQARQLTGRWDPHVAGAAALGTAGLAGLAGRALTPSTKPDDEDEDVPHPAG